MAAWGTERHAMQQAHQQQLDALQQVRGVAHASTTQLRSVWCDTWTRAPACARLQELATASLSVAALAESNRCVRQDGTAAGSAAVHWQAAPDSNAAVRMSHARVACHQTLRPQAGRGAARAVH
jgi:hypothetical protein